MSEQTPQDYNVTLTIPVNPSGFITTCMSGAAGVVFGCTAAVLNNGMENMVANPGTLVTAFVMGIGLPVVTGPLLQSTSERLMQKFGKSSQNIPENLREELDRRSIEIAKNKGFRGLFSTSTGAFVGAAAVSFVTMNGALTHITAASDLIQRSAIIKLTDEQKRTLTTGGSLEATAVIDGKRYQFEIGTPTSP